MGKFFKKLLATLAIVGVYSLPLAQEARSTVVGTTEADTDVTHLRLDTSNDPLTNDLEILQSGAGLDVTDTSDVASGEVARLSSQRATPADGDCRYINLTMNDDALAETDSVWLRWCLDESGGKGNTKFSSFEVLILHEGSLQSALKLEGADVGAAIDATVESLMITDDGSAADPAIKFNDTDTGIFQEAVGEINFSADNAEMMEIRNGFVDIIGNLFAANDTQLGSSETADVTTMVSTLVLATLTTGQRDSLPTVEGKMLWNTTLDRTDCYDGAAWVPCNTDVATKEAFFSWMTGVSLLGDFATSLVSKGGQIGRSTFMVPDDFSSIVDAELILVPDFTNASSDLDFETDYGGSGQAFNTHSESLTGSTYNLVTNQRSDINIAGALTSLAAGDTVGVALENNTAGGSGGGVHVLGIRFKYNTL